MNKTPSILVDTGFEVDQNGALEEIVIPKIVTTCNAPRKITFEGTTLNYMPSTSAALQEFDAPSCTHVPANCFKNFTSLTNATIGLTATQERSSTGSQNNGLFCGCTSLTTVSFPSLVTIDAQSSASLAGSGTFYNCSALTTVSLPSLVTMTCSTGNDRAMTGTFYNCISLTSINFPSLTTMSSNAGYSSVTAGNFYGCSGLTSVTLPALETLSATGSGKSGDFYGCTNLTTVVLPSLKNATESASAGGTFYGCTGLETVQLGSEGHPVTSIGNYMFNACTQSGLTITVYTADGNAISGSPWGATNATIVWEEA